MSITVSEITKPRFSDRDIWNIFRRHPFVEEEIERILSAEEQEEKRQRLAVLDALEENGRRSNELDAKIAAQRQRHDDAYAIYRREADLLGDLTQQRAVAQQTEGSLCCQLSANGERALDTALRLLYDGMLYLPARIRELEAALREEKPDFFDRRPHPYHADRIAELTKLRARFKKTNAALKTALGWVAARVSPREQTERVEKLMADLAAD